MSLLAQSQEAPLRSSALLRQVFGYIGKGESCFLRVNRQWNDIYVELFGARTTFDAAVASEARVEIAAAEGCPRREELCKKAAGNGNLGVCMKLKSLNCPCGVRTCAAAAEGGHLEVLKWLREGPDVCPWGAWICKAAAKGGHLDILKWLRQGPDVCPWNEYTCAAAAEGGHLEVLQWLRQGPEPCPWDGGACNVAARGGNLEVLQWLRQGPDVCPWDDSTCSAAACGGHLDILQWLRQGPEPCSWDGMSCPAWVSWQHRDHFDRYYQYEEGSDKYISIVDWVHANEPPCDCT
ncbi:unnamed protein product [Chrysoparadoxa australica]